MAEPRLYLFDDDVARDWAPFALTRPAGELLYGTATLRARAERALRLRCAGHLAAEHLEGFAEDGAPPVLTASPAEGVRLFLNARVALEPATWRTPAGPARVSVNGRTAGWYAPEGTAPPSPTVLAGAAPASDGAETVDLEGEWLDRIWDLMARNAGRIARDFDPDATRAALPGHVAVLGDPDHVQTGQVEFEPGVVLDVRDGPIRIEDAVTVRAGTRLAGPAWIGAGSTLLGGSISGVSIGPACKVRGEIEETVILGCSNKAHDGFLGHAYLGRWVNLGALTTNSDLKNNYGNVRVWTPAGETDTGLMKIGCLLGDHVKTGIGVMLNTGTVIGAGSNVFGAAQPPKYVPPFRWGEGESLTDYDLARFLDTANVVMARRGVVLGDGMRRMLERAWQRSRSAS